jgi:hypothetical protein
MTINPRNQSTPGGYFKKRHVDRVILSSGATEIPPAGGDIYCQTFGDSSLDREDEYIIKRSQGTKIHNVKISNKVFNGTNVSDYIKILEFEMKSYDLNDQEKISLLARNFNDEVKKFVITWDEVEQDDYPAFVERLREEYDAEDHKWSSSDLEKLAIKKLPLKSFCREFDVILKAMEEQPSYREKIEYFWQGLSKDERSICKGDLTGTKNKDVYESIRKTAKSIIWSNKALANAIPGEASTCHASSEAHKIDILSRALADMQFRLRKMEKSTITRRTAFREPKSNGNTLHPSPGGDKSERSDRKCIMCDNPDCEKRRCPWLKEYISDGRCTIDSNGWIRDQKGDRLPFNKHRGGVMKILDDQMNLNAPPLMSRGAYDRKDSSMRLADADDSSEDYCDFAYRNHNVSPIPDHSYRVNYRTLSMQVGRKEENKTYHDLDDEELFDVLQDMRRTVGNNITLSPKLVEYHLMYKRRLAEVSAKDHPGYNTGKGPQARRKASQGGIRAVELDMVETQRLRGPAAKEKSDGVAGAAGPVLVMRGLRQRKVLSGSNVVAVNNQSASVGPTSETILNDERRSGEESRELIGSDYVEQKAAVNSFVQLERMRKRKAINLDGRAETQTDEPNSHLAGVVSRFAVKELLSGEESHLRLGGGKIGGDVMEWSDEEQNDCSMAGRQKIEKLEEATLLESYRRRGGKHISVKSVPIPKKMVSRKERWKDEGRALASSESDKRIKTINDSMIQDHLRKRKMFTKASVARTQMDASTGPEAGATPNVATRVLEYGESKVFRTFALHAHEDSNGCEPDELKHCDLAGGWASMERKTDR